MKLILKCIWKIKESRIYKTILEKKSKVGRLFLVSRLTIKLQQQDHVTEWCWWKVRCPAWWRSADKTWMATTSERISGEKQREQNLTSWGPFPFQVVADTPAMHQRLRNWPLSTHQLSFGVRVGVHGLTKIGDLIHMLGFQGKSERLVVQSCLTLCNPMDHSLPGSSVHGILQARILEWIAFSFPSK